MWSNIRALDCDQNGRIWECASKNLTWSHLCECMVCATPKHLLHTARTAEPLHIVAGVRFHWSLEKRHFQHERFVGRAWFILAASTRARKCASRTEHNGGFGFQTKMKDRFLNQRRWTQCFPHIDFTWAGRLGILTAAQVYLVKHFLFLLLLLSLTLFFLSARDNETIRDRLNCGKTSPRPMRFILLVLCAQELSTLPQTIFSVSHTLIYLWRAATISTACCHQLPCLTHTSATLALYLVTFRPFGGFFPHNGYTLTNLATF